MYSFPTDHLNLKFFDISNRISKLNRIGSEARLKPTREMQFSTGKSFLFSLSNWMDSGEAINNLVWAVQLFSESGQLYNLWHHHKTCHFTYFMHLVMQKMIFNGPDVTWKLCAIIFFYHLYNVFRPKMHLNLISCNFFSKHCNSNSKTSKIETNKQKILKPKCIVILLYLHSNVIAELWTNTTTWSIQSSTSPFPCCFTQCITGRIGCITTTLRTKFGYGRVIQYAYYEFESRYRRWCCRLQNWSWQHDVLLGKKYISSKISILALHSHCFVRFIEHIVRHQPTHRCIY